MDHRCYVEGCRARLPREMLLCKRHWFSLSKPTRDKVWAAWKAYEAGGDAQTYFAVRDAAIAEANDRAGRSKQPTLF